MSRIHKTRAVLIGLSLLFGLIEARAGRFTMNPDSVSYLDSADDLLRGDLWNFINAHWSPIYPALLAIGRWLVPPSMDNALAVAHTVNYFIYVFAVVCFDAFCVQLLAHRRRWVVQLPPLPCAVESLEAHDCWLTLACFLLFWWASLRDILAWELLADELLLGSIFLCLAILLRIWNNRSAGWPWSLLLGLCLGFGYLCKAIFFPLALILLGMTVFAPGVRSRRLRAARCALALLGFALIAGPWIASLHYKYGRLTFSDSGKLNAIWWVNRLLPPMEVWWTNPTLGIPEHPLQPVLERPPVYVYNRPISGTYPPWKDPAWWLSGAIPRLDLGKCWARFKTESRALAHIALWNPLYDCLFVLFFASAAVQGCRGTIQWPSIRGEGCRALWSLTLFSAAGLGAYTMLLVLPQYVAVFLLLLAMAWLCWSTRFFPLVLPRRLRTAVAIMTILFAVAFLPGLAKATALCWPRNVVEAAVDKAGDYREHAVYRLRLSAELQQKGMRPGSRVALLGDAAAFYWACLCGVHVVAEVPAEYLHQLDSRESFCRALDVFRRAGAEFVVVTVHQVPVTGYGGVDVVNGKLRLIELR